MTLGLQKKWAGLVLAGIAIAVSGMASCSSDPSSLDPGTQKHPKPGSPCATPNDGCPCTNAGEQVACGEVLRKSGDYVTCSQGKRTCTAGVWGACVGDQTFVKSVSPTTIANGTSNTQDLQTLPNSCNDDPCDPACTDYVDNANGLEAGVGLTANDAGGLTLSAADGSSCVNLQCNQVSCNADGGATTTLTGKVIAGTLPAYGAADPLPNVLVYVPNTALAPFAHPIQCNTSCSADVSGTPIAATLTDFDGTFTLTNVPYGTNIPVVIQLGRWRRQFSIPNVPQCATTPTGDLRMPRNKGEGDIPLTAVSSGSVDALECVLLKMGVDAAEFTNPGAGGRIEMYIGNGVSVDVNTPLESNLMQDDPTALAYDQMLFPCWGGRINKGGEEQILLDYVNGGGRAFFTHYSYSWLWNTTPFSGTANWDVDKQSLGSTTGQIATGFPKGVTFAKWMNLVTVLSSSNPPKFTITNPRQDADSIINPPSVEWMFNADATNGGAWPLHFTFDTPVNAQATCGRVVFSDFHVANASTGPGTNFPNECTGGGMSAQEKALEFLLYDLASCGATAPPLVPPYPNPATFVRDYEGICPAGQGPVWRFFDWQTVTPSDSNIVFNAATDDVEANLGADTPVYLGSASGAPITNWVGTDVGIALAPTLSKHWLRITATLNPSSDHYYAPTLTQWRQLYDCIDNQ